MNIEKSESHREGNFFLDRIGAAFANTYDVIIGEDSLKQPQWFDELGQTHYYEDDLYKKILGQISGYTWPQLAKPSFLRWKERTEAPKIVSAKGLFLILPAYLLNADEIVISEYGEMRESAFTLEPLVASLTNPTSTGSIKNTAITTLSSLLQRDAMMSFYVQEFNNFRSLLNNEQVVVIRDFLRAHRDYFDGDAVNAADLAISAY